MSNYVVCYACGVSLGALTGTLDELPGWSVTEVKGTPFYECPDCREDEDSE